MTAAEVLFWQRARNRIAGLQPDVAAAILRAFQIIRDSLTEAEVAKALKSGSFDRLIDDALLTRAFLPFRQQLVTTVQRGFKLASRDLPKAGRIEGNIAVSFDHLSVHVIEAIRVLESKALDTLKGDVKETTRAFLENALRDGKPPSVAARQLRSVIGLAPNQEAAVRNFEAMLRSGDREALKRSLRDRRFDSTIEKAFGADGTGLKETQVESMTAAYKRKFVAWNASTNAKTHTFSAYKLGQKLSWQDAAEKGVIPNGFIVTRTWVHFDPQPDPRPAHIAMNGETVPMDDLYSNGDSYAGEQDPWNCHCIDRYGIGKAA